MAPLDSTDPTEITPKVDYGFALNDRYTKSDDIVYLTGMQALVRLLIEQCDLDQRQGLNTRAYVSGYRGSPIGAFDSAIWQAGDAVTDRGIPLQSRHQRRPCDDRYWRHTARCCH